MQTNLERAVWSYLILKKNPPAGVSISKQLLLISTMGLLQAPSAVGRRRLHLGEASEKPPTLASHPTFLAEEEELASEVIHAEGIGQCMSLRDVILRAEEIKQVSSDILGEQIIPSSITVPRAWPYAFMERNGLKVLQPSILSSQRFVVSSNVIVDFMDTLCGLMKENLYKQGNVYNFDETQVVRSSGRAP